MLWKGNTPPPSLENFVSFVWVCAYRLASQCLLNTDARFFASHYLELPSIVLMHGFLTAHTDVLQLDVGILKNLRSYFKSLSEWRIQYLQGWFSIVPKHLWHILYNIYCIYFLNQPVFLIFVWYRCFVIIHWVWTKKFDFWFLICERDISSLIFSRSAHWVAGTFLQWRPWRPGQSNKAQPPHLNVVVLLSCSCWMRA